MLKRIWAFKIGLQRTILVAAGLVMTAAIFYQVVSRYILNSSVYGLEDLAAYVTVWFYFIGAAMAAHRGAISRPVSPI